MEDIEGAGLPKNPTVPLGGHGGSVLPLGNGIKTMPCWS